MQDFCVLSLNGRWNISISRFLVLIPRPKKISDPIISSLADSLQTLDSIKTNGFQPQFHFRFPPGEIFKIPLLMASLHPRPIKSNPPKKGLRVFFFLNCDVQPKLKTTNKSKRKKHTAQTPIMYQGFTYTSPFFSPSNSERLYSFFKNHSWKVAKHSFKSRSL